VNDPAYTDGSIGGAYVNFYNNGDEIGIDMKGVGTDYFYFGDPGVYTIEGSVDVDTGVGTLTLVIKNSGGTTVFSSSKTFVDWWDDDFSDDVVPGSVWFFTENSATVKFTSGPTFTQNP